MLEALAGFYYRATLRHPVIVGLVALVLLIGAIHQAQHFRLDASSDALVLEGDEDLLYYREIRARYGSGDFLVVTYTPHQDLLSDASLETLASLRDDLLALARVRDVTSMLDVPLIDSPRQTLSDVRDGVRTLRDPDVDRDLAREELRTSPLYGNMLMNETADTTGMLLLLEPDDEALELLRRREELRLKRADSALTREEGRELGRVEAQYTQRSAMLQAELEHLIAEVREVLDRYRADARIHLGGMPMIAADMIDFVRDDIRTFGVGVGLFIVVLLAFAFRALRWVIVPAAICAIVAIGMVGFLGHVGWPVTVVSSNFISLILILTLSLIVHLIVRHRELHVLDPGADQATLLRGTIDSKFKPSVYTAATTMVAFGSLVYADIRPVIDFGLMMVCAVAFGFVVSFVLFPTSLASFPPGRTPVLGRDVLARFNLAFANLVRRWPAAVWAAFALFLLTGLHGMTRLEVENRFIDYFKSTSEIHQGMLLIDRELGGTTPLDVVLDPSAAFLEEHEDDWEDDEWEDDFGLEEGTGPTAGYWFNEFQLDEIARIHDWLDGLPATGKVLSLATTKRIITHLNDGEPLDTFALAVIYQQLPEELREALFDPFMAADGNQVRIDIRVVDSDPDLRRDDFLRDVEQGLSERFDLEPGQVNLSGMMVLYNNVMQSLFYSQFVTMGIVFAAIMLMFGFLFRSLRMAVIGPLPTLVAACMVLGMMGLLGIPLDIMTITISAITIGIGVHDTIHYTHRFEDEIRDHGDYASAVSSSHASVGRAMVYTTVIVTLGFSILVLSNFIPTIYFGLFTGVAMIFALLSNLTLLPLLLRTLRPFPAGGVRDGALARTG